MLRINYREKDQYAVIVWDLSDESEPWLVRIKRLVSDRVDLSYVTHRSSEIEIPWWSFISLRQYLDGIFSNYNLKLGDNFEIDKKASILLEQSKRASASYEAAINAEVIPESDIRERLKNIGFERDLSAEQARNVGRISALSAAATFSVPGAGKTTEALAYYFLRAKEGENLLIIAPKNAFATWDEEIKSCMPGLGAHFFRLRGKEKIKHELDKNHRFMIITYQQFAIVSELVITYCARQKIHVFLDESHRIKGGAIKPTAKAVLGLSHLLVGKLIMSGTPMPQSTDDLIPQFTFLYPEIPATSENVVQKIQPIFVRTNKKELGLPPVHRKVIKYPMAPMQKKLYQWMKSEVAREADEALNAGSKKAFRLLGKSVSRLLQFISNPALLSRQIEFEEPDLLAAVLTEGDGPKLDHLLSRARELVSEGKKVLIWSSFVHNVEYIAERLSDLGSVYIHGKVDTGDEDDDDTREGKIRQFHDDLNVMVANPAAASEGISLHKVCHHALYLDRTFNAAHYLQSVDRIHRFGLPQNQDTTIEIIECSNSIDETVRYRLNYKIGKMAKALNDSSLHPDPIALDPIDIEDEDREDYNTGLDQGDIKALSKALREEE